MGEAKQIEAEMRGYGAYQEDWPEQEWPTEEEMRHDADNQD